MVSDGCKNCYAATLAGRWHGIRWGKGQPRKRTSETEWQKPVNWNREAEEAGKGNPRVFCASMGDIFDREVEPAWRDDVFGLIGRTPKLYWLLLTKRPKEAVKYAKQIVWPANAWIGTSVENQAAAGRAEVIKEIPAPVRFLSVEPMLEPVKLNLTGIDWVIVGGESGPNYRSMAKAWVLDVQKQCQEAKVAFFFKQWASPKSDSRGHELNGEVCHAFPIPVERRPAPKVEPQVASAELDVQQ